MLNATMGAATTKPVVAVGSMVVLATLDLAGAVLAKRYADHRSWVVLAGGALMFGLLFLVYAHSLSSAELATVTFGWVVFLQIGVVIIDRIQRHVAIPPDRLVCMGGLLLLQGYLLLAPMRA
jgi:hypothetical protein